MEEVRNRHGKPSINDIEQYHTDAFRYKRIQSSDDTGSLSIFEKRCRSKIVIYVQLCDVLMHGGAFRLGSLQNDV